MNATRTEDLRIAYVRVTREAPWSLDPSVSTAGHETVQGPNKGFTDYHDLLAWCDQHAPEIDYTADPQVLTDYPERQVLLYTGRDARDYHTSVYITRWLETGTAW